MKSNLARWNITTPASIVEAELAIQLLDGEIRNLKLSRTEKAFKRAQVWQLMLWMNEQTMEPKPEAEATPV